MNTLPTDAKELQRQYWADFAKYLTDKGTVLPPSQNAHNTWCNFRLGTSRGTLEAVVNTKGSNRVELRIHGKYATETYRILESSCRKETEAMISNLEWDDMPDCILKRVYVEQQADINSLQDWPRQFEWMKGHLEVMYTYFKPKLKAL